MGEGAGNALGWSVELCGGTHVGRTGDIGLVSVVGEFGVAGGVRRIEALTARAARRTQSSREAGQRRGRRAEVPVDAMPARAARARRAAAFRTRAFRREEETRHGRRRRQWRADGVRTVGDVKLMARAVEGIDLKDLRSLADEGKKKVGSGIVAIVGVTGDGKAGIVVGVTSDLVARFNAVDLVRKGAEVLGGKGGGGRPDMAQAGGPDGAKADAALAAVEAALGA